MAKGERRRAKGDSRKALPSLHLACTIRFCFPNAGSVLTRGNPGPKWRNWQTRMVQVHVPARVWGFESLLRHQVRTFFEVPRCTRDFACGLPLRSRPQIGSSSSPFFGTKLGFFGPSLHSGFRLRAPASLTPANRLKFESLLRHQVRLPRSLAALGISPAGSRFAHARKAAQVRVPSSAPS